MTSLFSPVFSAEDHAWHGRVGPFYNQLKYLVIHHTEESYQDHPYQFDIVNIYHRDRFRRASTGKPFVSMLGYCLGYNAFCEKDGTLIWARLPGEETTAQLEHNDGDALSFCWSGNFNKISNKTNDPGPTPAQWKTLKSFMGMFPNLRVVFHRDLADRTCPGTRITHEMIYDLMGPEWVRYQAEIAKKIPIEYYDEHPRHNKITRTTKRVIHSLFHKHKRRKHTSF